MSDDLLQYIREHRATYTREALTAELVAAGHAAADVEAAWSQVGPTGWVAPAEKPYVRGASAYFAMLVVAIFYLGSVVWYLSWGGDLGAGRSPLVLILYSVAMIGAGAFVLRRLLQASTMGSIVGGFLIAIVLYIGLAGACIVGYVVTARH